MSVSPVDQCKKSEAVCPFGYDKMKAQAPPMKAQAPQRVRDDAYPINETMSPARMLMESSLTANDGWLSYTYGFCPPKPNRILKGTQLGEMLERWVQKLPLLYRTGGYLAFFRSQPVLTDDSLADEDLLRANAILGLAAHATWHLAMAPLNLGNSAAELPESILQPWQLVSKRLGRPLPTFTYYDYFTANVTHVRKPRDEPFGASRPETAAYDELKADVRLFDDLTEDTFVLLNHEMEYQSKELIALFCDAHDATLAADAPRLTAALFSMVEPIKRVTAAFRHSEPHAMSKRYVDQVAWSKSVGMIIPPISDGEFSLSGLQSSVTQVVDIFLGRHEFLGELGHLALDERPWLPSLHRAFFDALGAVSVRKFVQQSTDRELHAAFSRLVRLWASEEEGFMGAHRLKIAGYLELGIKTGRTASSGQTAVNSGWRSRMWRKVDGMCVGGIEERLRLQVGDGYTPALLVSCDPLGADGSTFELTFDIAGTGMHYAPGDRIQVAPQNSPCLVAEMMTAIGCKRRDPKAVKIFDEAWRQALHLHWGNAPLLRDGCAPLHAVLKLADLRPLTARHIGAVCGRLLSKVDPHDLEDLQQVAAEAAERGELADVRCTVTSTASSRTSGLGKRKPSCAKTARGAQVGQLINLVVHSKHGSAADIPGLADDLCSVLWPLAPRNYSITSCAGEGAVPTRLTVVISSLWYQQESRFRQDQGKTHQKGVASTYMVDVAQGMRYLPCRVVEVADFHLPPASAWAATPLVFVGLGSGVAPMLAFLEELASARRTAADSEAMMPPSVTLIWGLRTLEQLHKQEELLRFVAEADLQLLVCFSQEDKELRVVHDRASGRPRFAIEPGKRCRITTKLAQGEWPSKLCSLIEAGALFYLCGHPSLASTLRSALEHALTSGSDMDGVEAAHEYERLSGNGRIRADLFFSGQQYCPKAKRLSHAEVARHHEMDDLYVIFKGLVYDLTQYAPLHPGGAKLLFDKAGRDCTKDFEVAHGANNTRIQSMFAPHAALVK